MTYSCLFTQLNFIPDPLMFSSVSDLYQYLLRFKEDPDVSITISKIPDGGDPVIVYTGTVGHFLTR